MATFVTITVFMRGFIQYLERVGMKRDEGCRQGDPEEWCGGGDGTAVGRSTSISTFFGNFRNQSFAIYSQKRFKLKAYKKG